MPSDALPQKAYVKHAECDGRYRAYPHHSGMFYLAAYTRQADEVTRTLHGPVIRNRRMVCFFSDEGEARGCAERLNVRMG